MSDMGRDKELIDEIGTKIKGIGDAVKDTEAKVRKDLADVRTLAEDSKASADTLANGQADLVAKYGKLEAEFKAMEAHAASVEAMVKRSHLGDGKGDAGGDEAKHAMAFKRHLLSEAGRLMPDMAVELEDADLKEFQDFSKAHGRYLRVGMNRLLPDEVRALSVGTDPMGGYWVKPAMSARISTIVYETSPLRQLATVETIGTDKLEVAIDDGEFGAGWVGEQEERPETSTPTLGTQVILVHELYAQPYMTQKLLDDAAVDIEAWVARKLGEKFVRVENTAFMTGDGIKRPRGLLTYPATAPVAGSTRGWVNQYVTGSATEITADSLVRMPWSLKDAYLGNAAWLFKRASLASIALFKAEGGQYLWQMGLTGGTRGLSSLVGYPFYTADDMPAVAAGALVAAFGDFRQAYTIVDRLGMAAIRDNVTTKGYVKYYTRKRVGGDIVNFDAIALLKVST